MRSNLSYFFILIIIYLDNFLLSQYFAVRTHLSKNGLDMKFITTILKRDIIPETSFQVLPNNRLEEDVKKIAYSFNLPLGLFLFSKYTVHNNHIYPNQNKWQLLLSFCRMMFFNAICCFRMHVTLYASTKIKMENITSTDVFLYIFVLSVFSIVHVFCFTMIFILDIVHKHNNVSLILKIQTIHKSVDLNKSIQSYIIWNWISILFIICINFSLIMSFYISILLEYTNVVKFIIDIFVDLLFVVFDINLIIAIRVTVLLRKYIDEWIKHILVMNNDKENKEQCHKLLEIYKHILNVYNLYKTIFQVLVSCDYF